MSKKNLWDEPPNDYDDAIDDLVKRGVSFSVKYVNDGEHILCAEKKERKFDKNGILMNKE